MHRPTCLASFVLAVCLAAPAYGQAVKLEFQDGRVNLSAQNVPLRQVLTEWSRLGGTRIINAERVSGPPVTLELTGVPERQALDILLRSVTGYVLAPRPAGSTARSTFDSILIVPTSSAPRPASAAPVPPPRPAFAPPPVAIQPPVQPDPDPEEDPPGDVAPDEPAEDRPGVRRLRRPGELTPPFLNPNRGVAQPPVQPDPEGAGPDEEQDTPQPQPTRPANPFGVAPGSNRPGSITPVPQPQRPANQQPQVGEEP